jgi:serine protease AprX
MRKTLALTLSLATALAVAVPAAAAPKDDPLAGASVTAAASIGAPDSGYTGKGVGVALIDTGVSPQPTLSDRIAARIDVSGTGRVTDGFGHGTFLSGLIVGQEGPTGTPIGIAPDAHLVSIQVADAEGRTSLDRVLAGLAAVKAAPASLNLRVIVLALGGPSDDQADPLEEALEQMWAEGYVVVVASGNYEGQLTEPGTSPYLITAGAIDDRGTAAHDDDTVPAWSGYGVGRDGNSKPDLLAPGKSVVSSRVPGSSADRENPGSRIEGRWFRGSGTSMAAAVTGGAAAVLLEAEPTLSPDEVKGRLVASTRAVDGSTAGVIDIPAALTSDAVANTHLPKLDFVAPGEPDDATWVGRSWIGRSWIGRSWIDHSWDGRSWIGRSWIGRSWIDLSWDGRSWIGRSWIDHSWDGRSWIGRSWIGRSWIGAEWTAGSWLSRDW